MTHSPLRWTSLAERDALLAAADATSRDPGMATPSAAAADGDHGHAHPEERADALAGPAALHAHETGASDVTRRTFLAAAGFSLAGALGGCGRAPTQTAAPGSTQPEETIAGISTWYATTCGGCTAGCGLIVRCRDGRPVKIEGLPAHPVSHGGVCAVGQAQLLSLYDSRRLRRPALDGKESAWKDVDARVVGALAGVRSAGGAVRVLTGTVTSPSTLAAVARFLDAHPGGRHVVYDALSASALLDAHARAFGVRALPRYRLERATVILGVEADFLGTHISPVEFTHGWRAGRTLEGPPPRLSFHAQVESALSLTGSNADRRFRVAPGQVGPFVAHLAARGAARGSTSAPVPADPCPVPLEALDDLVDRLVRARGAAVVLCGSNDLDVQRLVIAVNAAIGAYGATIDVKAPSFQRRGDDAALAALIDEMEAGKVAALLVAGCNPVADAADGARLAAALAKVPTRIGLAERADETTARLSVVLPAPHAFESWDDAEPVAGVFSVSQPLIRPFGEPRTLRECLAAWAGKPAPDPELVRATFAKDVVPRARGTTTPVRLWRQTVREGFLALTPRPSETKAYDAAAVASAAPRAKVPAAGRLALVLGPSVGMLDGRHAQNPWLQELPDPITKLTWGNAASLSPATASALNLSDGDVVRVAAAEGGVSVELPVLVQAGLADGVVAIPLGYGRLGTDRFAGVGPAWIEARPTVRKGEAVGRNASGFLTMVGGAVAYAGREVTVTRTGAREALSLSQTWGTQDLPKGLAPRGHERRDAVRETTLAAFSADPASGNAAPHAGADLWSRDHATPGARWGMAIDLGACTGCSACVIACQSENNVPVVGKDEVRRRRDMAWLRIDRYYADVPGSPGDVDVVHQPMLCQHCENAPCETVCPVLATVHSSDGLNAQVYNRCVGTRYCANNCPYKVRRFNWFEYASPDSLADLALNPDVTVRSRGVMEKCSFCVQRLHEARAEAKRAGRPLADGEARTACQQSCPAQAIVFGDLNDPKSRVAALLRDPRRYRVLEELNVKPSVGYLTKVRHRDGPAKGASHD